MSGSIPLHCKPVIFDSFALMPNAKVICMSSDQPELEYILEPALGTSQDIADRVKAIVRRHLVKFDPDDCMLVFVPYLDKGKKLAKMLGCSFYSGQEGTGDKDQ